MDEIFGIYIDFLFIKNMKKIGASGTSKERQVIDKMRAVGIRLEWNKTNSLEY
jgi:hypothetical protein